jgi:hypothetical protein
MQRAGGIPLGVTGLLVWVLLVGIPTTSHGTCTHDSACSSLSTVAGLPPPLTSRPPHNVFTHVFAHALPSGAVRYRSWHWVTLQSLT